MRCLPGCVQGGAAHCGIASRRGVASRFCKVLQNFSRVLKRGLVTTGSRGHAQWVFLTSSTLSTLFLTSFTLYIADWREQGSSGGTVDDAQQTQSNNLEASSPHISYTLNSAAQIAISTISSIISEFSLASIWHRQIKEHFFLGI